MKPPLLLLDVNYLAHRAFHAMGALTYNDDGMGAIYGVMKDIVHFQDMFKTARIVFAFDYGRGKRNNVLPSYKGSRLKKLLEGTDEERAARKDLSRQINLMRSLYLPSIGYNNVLYADGIEADDVIASLARDLPEEDEAIIISADHDLYQCLRPNVWIWNAHSNRAVSMETFTAEWGISPDKWADVKAYAGCSTDDVPGVDGVGEKTAVKFIKGELGVHTKACAKLLLAQDLHDRNMQLVRLPFPTTPKFTVVDDDVTEEKWTATMNMLSFNSLINQAPNGLGRKSRGRKRDGYKKEGFGLNRS